MFLWTFEKSIFLQIFKKKFILRVYEHQNIERTLLNGCVFYDNKNLNLWSWKWKHLPFFMWLIDLFGFQCPLKLSFELYMFTQGSTIQRFYANVLFKASLIKNSKKVWFCRFCWICSKNGEFFNFSSIKRITFLSGYTCHNNTSD